MRRCRWVYWHWVGLTWAGLIFCFLAAAAAIAQPTAEGTASKIVPTPNIGHGANVELLALSAGNQYLATSDKATVKLWQLVTDETRGITGGRLMRTLQAIPQPQPMKNAEGEWELVESVDLTSLEVSRDGALVFGGDQLGRLHKWDAITGDLVKSVAIYSNSEIMDRRITSLAVTPDDATVIAACSDSGMEGGIVTLDAGTLEPRGARDGGTWQLAISPDGGSVVVSDHTRAEVLGLPDLRPIRRLEPAVNAVQSRVTDEGRDVLVTQHADGGGSRWQVVNISTGETRELALDKNIHPKSMGPGGRLLVENRSLMPDNFSDKSPIEIITPSLAGGDMERVRLTRDLQIDTAIFSADGLTLVTAEGNVVEVWDTRTGTPTLRLEGPQPITSLSLSGDGRRLLALDEAGFGFLWRSFEGELDQQPLLHEREANAVLSHDGKDVVTSWKSSDDSTQLSVLDGTGVKQSLPPAGWRPLACWQTEDGLIDLVSDSGDAVALWDIDKREMAHRLALPSHAGRPSRVEVNKERSHALVVLEEAAADQPPEAIGFLLWNLATERMEQQFREIEGKAITTATLSPDGRWLVLGASDKTNGSLIEVRNIASGTSEKRFRLEAGRSLAFAEFSPGGSYYIANTSWTARWGQTIYRTSDWHYLGTHVASRRRQVQLRFLDSDRRVLASEAWAFRTRRHALRTGVDPNEKPLLNLPTRPARLIKTAVDAKGERVAVADGADVVVIRGSDGAIQARLSGHLADVSALRFLPNGNWLASGGRDGTVRLWNLRTGELAVTYTADKDGQWLAVTPAGFYAGSDRPGRLMSVVHGQDVYSIEQFYGPLYRPDLVKALLSGDPMGLHKDAAAKLNLGVVLERGGAPTVLKHERPRRAGDTMQFTVRISNNSGGGIGRRLIWRVNGAVAGRTEPEELANRTDPDAPVTVTEGLKLDFKHKGGNEVTVIAFDGGDDGQALASEPLVFKIEPDGGVSVGDEVAPRMHVLAIGVNSYDTRLTPNDNNLLTPLTLAVGDVQRLKSAIAQVSVNGGYKQGLMRERVEAEATRERIEDAFRELAAEVKPVDAFVLLLAGHGNSVDGRYYYYPVTTKFGEGRNNDTDAIAVETWQKWLAMVPATKKLIVIDTCRSSDFLGRGDNDEDTAVDRLRRAVGRSVITAARDTAFESRHLKHGILTYAMLKALAQPRADGRDITLSTLKERIPPDVKKLSIDLGQPAQKTRILVEDDFEIGLPVPALAPSPVASVEILAGEWIVKEETPARKSAEDMAEVNETLKAYTLVRIARFEGKWALVVHKGTKVGWVLADKLAEINKD